MTAGTIYLHPFMVFRLVTPSKFGLRVSATGAAGTALYGIWSHNLSTGQPVINANPLIYSTTTVDTTAAGAYVSAAPVATAQLVPGVVYWWGSNYSAAPTMTATSGGSPLLSSMLGATLLNNVSQSNGYTMTSAYANGMNINLASAFTATASIPIGVMEI